MEKRTLWRDVQRRADRDMIAGSAPQPKFREHALRIVFRPALRTALPILLVTGLFAPTSSAQAAQYEFDPRRTEVRFAYKVALSTQRGRFTKVAGVLEYDDKVPEKSKVTASVTAASISTGDALVDSQLKGADFFNVETAPVIAFKSLNVQPKSATAADVAGEITIKGITQRVILKVRIRPHDDPALKFDAGAHRFVATTRIRRSAFNMTAYESFVGDDVELVIDAIVRPKRKSRKQSGR